MEKTFNRHPLETQSSKEIGKAENLRGRLMRYDSLRGIAGWSANQKFSPIRPGPEDWLVYGRISGPDGKGISDLRVSVLDKDLLFDDRLGEAVTGADGEFYLLYHRNDFKDLVEKQPDLYLKVINKKGRTLFTSEKAVRWQSDRVEYFEIQIR